MKIAVRLKADSEPYDSGHATIGTAGSVADHQALANTLESAAAWAFAAQEDEGFWVGNVDTNVCIEAEWLLASHILGVGLPDEEKIIEGLIRRQRKDGSWEVYFDAPEGDINGTVEAYAALTAKGFSADDPILCRARNWILAHGGLSRVRVFTKYWLSMIGVWPWSATPNLPPEIIRLPSWFPFNIHNFAQWARATLVPLAVIAARQPVWALKGNRRLEELFPSGYEAFDFWRTSTSPALFSTEWFFYKLDWALHKCQSAGLFFGRHCCPVND